MPCNASVTCAWRGCGRLKSAELPQFVLGGHLHPACRIHGRGRDSLRLPCFVSDERQVILPAFDEFTGGWIADAAPDRTGPDRTGPDRRFYAVGGGAVWPLPG